MNSSEKSNRKATHHQRNYMDVLIKACQRRGIELPVELLEEINDEDLTCRRASEIIDELKFEIGWM